MTYQLKEEILEKKFQSKDIEAAQLYKVQTC